MIEAVTAILGLFSASVFVAHAIDAYRAPWAGAKRGGSIGYWQK
jgi:hypothetical protein